MKLRFGSGNQQKNWFLDICDRCNGEGELMDRKCLRCNGSGMVRKVDIRKLGNKDEKKK